MTTTFEDVLNQCGDSSDLWQRALQLQESFGDRRIRLTLSGHERETTYHFKMGCEPAEGGSAVVFKVTQEGREVDFALKVLIADITTDAALRQRWQDECLEPVSKLSDDDQ